MINLLYLQFRYQSKEIKVFKSLYWVWRMDKISFSQTDWLKLRIYCCSSPPLWNCCDSDFSPLSLFYIESPWILANYLSVEHGSKFMQTGPAGRHCIGLNSVHIVIFFFFKWSFFSMCWHKTVRRCLFLSAVKLKGGNER